MKYLPIESLQTFVCVAEQASFTEAGRILKKSQPAVSLQIKKLEEGLDSQLFIRDGHTITLNATGRLLYDYALQMLQLNDTALRQLVQHDIRGTLKVGMPSEFASQLLPTILGQFAKDYPHVRLDAVCDLSRSLQASQRRDHYDITLTLNRNEACDFEDELVWVCSGKSNQSLDQTALVLAPQGCMYREAALSALKRAGIEANISYTNADLSGITAAVQQDLGVTVLAKSTVPSALSIMPEAVLPLGKIGIRLNVHNVHSQAASKLAHYIKASLQQQLGY